VERRKRIWHTALALIVSATMLASVLVVVDNKPEDWDLVDKLTDTGYAYHHTICHCGNVTHLAYVDGTIGHDFLRVAYVSSKDGGSTWSPVQILASGQIGVFGKRQGVKIACAADEVHIIWVSETWVETQSSSYSVEMLHHRASVDGGRSWREVQILNEFVYLGFDEYDVFPSEDLVLVAWTTRLSIWSWDPVTLYVTSQNQGVNWSEERILFHSTSTALPRIQIHGGTVYALPRYLESGDDIVYVSGMLAISEDITETWDYIDIKQMLGLDELHLTGLARKGDELVVTSRQGLLRSEDGGLNWTFDGANAFSGSLAQRDDLLVAGYCSMESLLLSRDFGATWSEVALPLPDIYWSCDLSIDDTRLFLSFSVTGYSEHNSGTEEIYISTSEDDGETWRAPRQVTYHFSIFNVAFLAIAIGGVVVTSFLLAMWGAREYTEGRQEKGLKGQQLRVRWFSDAHREDLASEKSQNPDGIECSNCQGTRMYICDDGSGICLDCRQAFAESSIQRNDVK
jgi:hypothetical protein